MRPSPRQPAGLFTRSVVSALFAASLLSATAAEQGTKPDRSWWSFRPLQRPALPKVSDTNWVRSPIDHFLLAAMERDGVRPAPRAQPHVLLRRLSLDVNGLPPEPGEVEAFERDASQSAWEAGVTRALARSTYGERWARHWLDVARFAESSGFEHDYDRPHAYHYRDYVIRALNRDQPFDQFARWQVAGDELAPDDPEALMATGFLGAGVFPTQITANEVERTRYDAMDDMLSTTSSAFLGLSVGCARCHDHKSDPISTDEYYRLLATFTTTVRSEVDRDLDPARTRRERDAYEVAHAPLVQALAAYERDELPAKFESWLRDGIAVVQAPVWEIAGAVAATSRAGAMFEALPDGSHRVQGTKADADRHEFSWVATGRAYTALRLEALPDEGLVKKGPGRADNGNFALSRLRVTATPAGGGEAVAVSLANPRADFQQNEGGLSVASSLDDNPRTGWAIDPKFGERHAAVFDFAQPVGFEGGTRFTVTLEYDVNTRHQIGRPRLALSTANSPSWDGDDLPAEVASALARLQRPGVSRGETAKALSPAERSALLTWWKRSEPGWKERRTRVEAHARTEPKPALTRLLLCGEGYTPVRMHTQGADFFPETFLLSRGSTDLKRGVAAQGFLSVLSPAGMALDDVSRWASPVPAGAKFSGRRSTLAAWMTDLEHGGGALMARVIVNRLWLHHFGRALVSTPNDYGRQGAPPTHPELLEWLASELVAQNWRLKPIHELILRSAAYQVSSRTPTRSATPDHAMPAASATASADYSRYTARRLEGEVIRDSLLAVCGVLDPTPYGPGTLDEASVRRSVYFTVKRSRLVSVMQAFDAPEPLVSQGARPTTTVAPQALFLMNNPHVRSWVLAGAQRLERECGGDVEHAIRSLYRRALARPPTPSELAAARAFLAEPVDMPAPAPAAGDPVRTALTLALADLTQVVLSLNEFSYVE